MSERWSLKDLQRMLRNAKRRYAYWNAGCKRTSAKAHEMKELYAADIQNLRAFIKDR